MPEVLFIAGAVAAGGCVATGVFTVARTGHASADSWLARNAPESAPSSTQRTWPIPSAAAAIRGWLAVAINRAGWHDSPERVAALSATVASGLGALGLSTAVFTEPATSAALAVAGVAAGFGTVGYALRSAIAGRRRRLTRELAPLLELFVLELSGGGSALSALGSVTMQVDSELAAELRRLLIASQVSGTPSFETRLRELSDRLQVPALGSLATILTASREYGTGVTQGVRALAADLRRAQRRELIAHSRRALNHVLFPAAIGVLLPFLAILLFPAVTALQRNLR